jgi:hypothetical protein
MLYKQDWEKAKIKFNEYWAGENHDRPLLQITAPRHGYKKKEVKAPEKLQDRWMDLEYIIKSGREEMNATFYGAEAFPMIWPNLGPDIFGATFGGDIVFEETTSYAKPFVNEWSKLDKLVFDHDNKWWKKIKSMTEEIAADAKGDYFVGITDIHPGADGLVSIRGPERLCMDLYDCPDIVKQRIFDLLPAFREQLDTLYEITSRNLPGSSNWMGVWHPDKWYVTSSDFITMISPDMFEEFILPELTEEIEWLNGRTIFHLDGPGALKHLDALLEIPKLAGIQWVYGAGQPTAAHWIPVLKRIQDAGKLIHVNIVPEDLDVLLEELRPEGVMYCLPEKCDSEYDAGELIRKVEKAYKKKFF